MNTEFQQVLQPEWNATSRDYTVRFIGDHGDFYVRAFFNGHGRNPETRNAAADDDELGGWLGIVSHGISHSVSYMISIPTLKNGGSYFIYNISYLICGW